ncbi:uncharacterized protein AMSG_02353 [Thecamonas trahens ATCC 50062]|uniref:Ras-GAP domain-containing protein n=1 Tax=Thecamonas trahens ATCC 50062 TaxID=461836 RepID=A0A0L0DVN8_THETB|nr:hypothetical protein AMSG_02353 [Thecamonas trahens ATCC 50062]KNC56384.1 hypothetical protein AMSG_02353 [Thecamonas trahens ATCC 50062]|eukprot:XP_013760898.1 hypothetical protein AMSG_02353 [Thecamonas trahens ATCC 50062]
MALFKKKGKDGKKGVDRYMDMVQLVVEPDLAFVTAITNACHVSKQAAILDSIVYIMERQEKTIEIIKHGITQTVKETQDGGTLFRENTTVTKLMTAYAKTIGKNYLVNTLKRLVTLLFSSTEGFEVNPAKADPDEDLVENLNNLMDWCERFVEQIVQTVDAAPIQFREICQHLQVETAPKFPKSQHMVVGGFIFLRFFCPAILSPQQSGLANDLPTPEQRRRLVLVAKALQNLSNGVQYGSKEAYLNAMNEFFDDYQGILYNYFDAMATLPDSHVVSSAPTSGLVQLEDSDLPSLHSLHKFVYESKDAMVAAMEKEGNAELLANFHAMLEALGTPPKT